MRKHSKRNNFKLPAIILSILVLTAVAVFLTIKLLPKVSDTDISPVDDFVSSELFFESSVIESVVSEPEKTLIMSSPSSKSVTVTEDHIVFSGISDPDYPLLIDGEEIKRDAKGAFSVEKKLKIGDNTFEVKHKDIDTKYTVNYKYIIVKSYSPTGAKSYASGASFAVTANARSGAKLTAVFNGKTVTMTKTVLNDDEEELDSEAFSDYAATFSLPSDNAKDLSLGKVKITAEYNGMKETYSTGNITCKKANIPVIAEVVSFGAETFNGNTTDDMSRPTNNYFPKGTVDYVVGRAYNGDKEYLKLRCGRRVYVTKKNGLNKVNVTKQYSGKLPSDNKISVSSLNVTKHSTEIVFDTQWKAPFFLDLLPQSYYNPSTQDYRVSSVTAKYVEITFCYASSIDGSINLGDNNPIFASYSLQKSGSNYKLRLNFRKVGAFYGWNAQYNSKGQLVFTFLHPAQVKSANNKYGADLTGVTVMIDVGHGGSDSGAVGIGNLYEKTVNLTLANLLKKELQSVGATVVMNRTGDTTLNPDERCMALIKAKPDFCIAIHHDASTSSVPNGFGAFYSTIFSSDAAKNIYNSTMSKGLYYPLATNNRNRLEWHYYYVARMTVCPVVLTENGFITASVDYPGISSSAVNTKKAEAIAEGIAKYFLSIRSETVQNIYDILDGNNTSWVSDTSSVADTSSNESGAAVSGETSSNESSTESGSDTE